MHLFVFGLLLSLAFLPGIIDLATVPRWGVLAVGLPICLLLNQRAELPATRWLGPITLGLMAMTAFWANDTLTALQEVSWLCIIAVAFYLGAITENLKSLWIGLAYGVAVSSFVAVGQRLGYFDLLGGLVGGGLFTNKILMAEASMVCLIAMLAYGKWILSAILFVGFCAAASRGALVGLIAGILCWLYVSRPQLAVRLGAVCAAIGVGIFLYMNSIHHESVTLRLEMWKAALTNATLIGHGVGSYSMSFPTWEHAHSDFFQAIYECGIFALPFTALMIYLVVEGRDDVEKFVLVSVIASGLFAFPLHMPFTAFAAAIAAGSLIGRGLGVRHSLYSWGADYGFPIGRSSASRSGASSYNGRSSRCVPPFAAYETTQGRNQGPFLRGF